jgi:hypothetical protein
MDNLIIIDLFGTDEEQHVKIDGYRGKWSAIEKTIIDDATYYIYEHDSFGDETCYLVVEFIDDMPMRIFETYDGLEQCLIDEEVI